MRFGIVVAEWNREVTEALLEGAVRTLRAAGCPDMNIQVKYVPGTFELSLGAQFFAEYTDVDDFLKKHEENKHLYFFSTKAQKCYSDIQYGLPDEDIYLIFGKESKGIEEDILFAHKDHTVRIPMIGETRSLNLSNSVAIAVYEVLRQQGFPSFKRAGNLRKYSWEDAI